MPQEQQPQVDPRLVFRLSRETIGAAEQLQARMAAAVESMHSVLTTKTSHEQLLSLFEALQVYIARSQADLVRYTAAVAGVFLSAPDGEDEEDEDEELVSLAIPPDLAEEISAALRGYAELGKMLAAVIGDPAQSTTLIGREVLVPLQARCAELIELAATVNNEVVENTYDPDADEPDTTDGEEYKELL